MATAAKKARVGSGDVRAMADDDMFRAKPAAALGAGGLPASLKKVAVPCTVSRCLPADKAPA